MRTRNEVKAPHLNDELDSEEWYQHATLALDVISIGGASATGLMTIRGIKLLRAEGITTRQALEGLNRQQRRRLSREIARSNAPGVSNKTVNYSGLKPPSFGALRNVRPLSFLTNHPLRQQHSPLASYEG